MGRGGGTVLALGSREAHSLASGVCSGKGKEPRRPWPDLVPKAAVPWGTSLQWRQPVGGRAEGALRTGRPMHIPVAPTLLLL